MDKFIIQLKQRVPLHHICIDELVFPLDEVQQDKILAVLREISQSNTYYSMNIIKKLIDKLERSNTEINESYYECLMEWLSSESLKPTDLDLITYTFTKQHQIVIHESPNLISGLGTTGLRTWEASLFLSQYLLESSIPNSRDDILELGCGTGMVSISMLKQQQNENVEKYGKLYITDGDSQLFQRVKENIELNHINLTSNDYEIRKLWWGEDYIPESVKTLIAADVTYDASVIPDLVHVINEGMTEGKVETVYIAATRRNEETLHVWEKWLDMGVTDQTWTWEIIATHNPMTKGTLFYGITPIPISLYRITKT